MTNPLPEPEASPVPAYEVRSAQVRDLLTSLNPNNASDRTELALAALFGSKPR